MKKFDRGLFPLSGDPVTFGHLDLITRAATDCEELVVLLCQNDGKRGSYLFRLEERVAMMERAVKQLGIAGVRVQSWTGLLVDFFSREACDVIFRGIRDDRDRKEEERQMRYHTMIAPEVEGKVVYLEADPQLKDVSSTTVKAFISHGIEVTEYVPAFVKELLEERILHQWKLGVAGEIACGKTWLTDMLTDELKARGYETHVVRFDELVRHFYAEASPGARAVREELVALLGEGVLTVDRHEVVRSVLFARMFDPATPEATRDRIRALTAPHIMRLYRQALRGVRGVILVEWAQLAEMHMGSFVNHRTLVIESPDRAAFAMERGLGDKLLKHVAATQWSAERKSASLARDAREAGGGLVLRYENHRAEPDEAKRMVRELADEILQYVPKEYCPLPGGAS